MCSEYSEWRGIIVCGLIKGMTMWEWENRLEGQAEGRLLRSLDAMQKHWALLWRSLKPKIEFNEIPISKFKPQKCKANAGASDNKGGLKPLGQNLMCPPRPGRPEPSCMKCHSLPRSPWEIQMVMVPWICNFAPEKEPRRRKQKLVSYHHASGMWHLVLIMLSIRCDGRHLPNDAFESQKGSVAFPMLPAS